MSIQSCTCTNPKLGDMGRANCTIEMRVVAFPIFFPRFKADGTRNTIDLTSGTLGADIQAKIAASTAALERLYPFPRIEEPTWDRTDTGYDTASSTQRYKVYGLGGVYTFAFQTWGKDSSFQQMREALKFGCTEIDMVLATVDGNLWGILDNPTDTDLRGYELNTETFDSFYTFATSTTVSKGMFSVDLDNVECVENSYAILASEMTDTGGVKSTSLAPNQAAFQTLTSPSNTTLQTVVQTTGGSAVERDTVDGLAPASSAAAFTVYDETADAAIVPTTAVESPDGTYLITVPAMTATNIIRVEVTAAGFDVDNATVAAS